MARRIVRAAAAQYPIEEMTAFAAIEEKLARWVEEAVAQGAQLLVFPEYAAMELARLAGRETALDLHGSIEALQDHIGAYEAAHAELAKRHGIFVISGSAPVRLSDGRFVNRAYVFGPNGPIGFQQKNIVTRFEGDEWGISRGVGLCVFDIGIAKFGIAICYDSEFPLIARALAEGGAEILIAPSCTETLAGYYRVKHACAARALENQIYAIQSPTVGEAPWTVGVEMNVGAAGFFAPPDKKFPGDGVLALGTLNKPEWVYADLDLDLLAEVRRDGDVLNNRDWPLQPGAPTLPPVKRVTMR